VPTLGFIGVTCWWICFKKSKLTRIRRFFFLDNLNPNIRKPILTLYERFECGGGWGLERTFDRWVCQQPWRKRLPLTFFELLVHMSMSNQLWNVGQLFFILGDFLMFGPCLKVRFDVEALYLQFISFSSLIDPLKTKPYLDIFGDWPIDPIGSPRYN
jgi:hypothetical protein